MRRGVRPRPGLYRPCGPEVQRFTGRSLVAASAGERHRAKKVEVAHLREGEAPAEPKSARNAPARQEPRPPGIAPRPARQEPRPPGIVPRPTGSSLALPRSCRVQPAGASPSRDRAASNRQQRTIAGPKGRHAGRAPTRRRPRRCLFPSAGRRAAGSPQRARKLRTKAHGRKGVAAARTADFPRHPGVTPGPRPCSSCCGTAARRPFRSSPALPLHCRQSAPGRRRAYRACRRPR